MKVSIVRAVLGKLPESLSPRIVHRFINGKAGHQLALLSHLHKSVAGLDTLEPMERLAQYADTIQAVYDLAALNGISQEDIHEAMADRTTMQGNYNSGIVRIVDGLD